MHDRYTVATFVALLLGALVSAASGQEPTEFALPAVDAVPYGIVAGPDGNLWFTEFAGNKIGRITTAGVITEFAVPTAGSFPGGIVAGPDDALWFSERVGNKIGRITTDGVITNEFVVPTPNSGPFGIARGPDGALWFTEIDANKIGQITTDGVVTEFTVPTTASLPTGITRGPDDALWFTEQNGGKVGRITPAGAITEFTVPTASGRPVFIITGPDGALWFTEFAGNKIGRITTAGVVTEIAIPTANGEPVSIAAGSDAALWFTEGTGNKIGRITTAGAISEFAVPTPDSGPFGIASGPDGALWFTENRGNKIGQITTAGVITNEFVVLPASASPISIAAGPDGDFWFTEKIGNKIGRITTDGVITEFVVPTPNSGPFGIASGPDGALWFTEIEANKIGRITTAGVINEFNIPTARSEPFTIAGADGALWFTEFIGNKIGRITTAGVITECTISTASSQPMGIVAGPDGAIWFTENGGNKIGRVTTADLITNDCVITKEYAIPTVGSFPVSIAAGPDGALWFTEFIGRIGRITTAGLFGDEFAVNRQPNLIAKGPDGALWFTEQDANKIGRITTAGAVSEFPIMTSDSAPFGIAADPNGALWFTEISGNKIGRILTGTIPPTVLVTGPSTGRAGAPLTFTANVIGGLGPYTFAWVCDFNILSLLFVPGQQTVACTYSAAGTFTVKARVTDSNGLVGFSAGNTVTITAPVSLPAPSTESTVSGVALSVFGGYAGTTGVPITFTSIETNAGSYFWDFGDGTSATTRSFTKTYNTPGSFVASLTVTGDGIKTSGTASATFALNITSTAIPLPSVAFTITGATLNPLDGNYTGTTGVPITFAAIEPNATRYAWSFGDGTSLAGRSVTHTYSTAGSFSVQLAVTGDGIRTAGTTVTPLGLKIQNPAFRALIVPGVAHLDLGASVWGTDVTVTNPGSSSIAITPNFVPYLPEGSLDTLDLSQIPYDPRLSFQLGPGASWSQVDVVNFLGGGSNKGTLVLKYEGGSSDPVVTARVYFAAASDPQGGSYGAAFPSYKISGQNVETAIPADQTIIGLRSNGAYRFVVTLYNAASTKTTFRLNAFDETSTPVFLKDASGQFVGFRDFTIGPFQQVQVRDDDLGLTDPNRRYVLKASRVSGVGTLIASGTALDRKTSDLVVITDDTPSTLAESGIIAYYVAGVAHLDTSRARWRTDLRIFNKSSKVRNLSFEFDFTGITGGAEKKSQITNLPIAGNALLTYDDVVDSLLKVQQIDPSVDLSGDTAGVLRIFYPEDDESATKPLIVGSRNYNDPSDGSGTAGTQLGVYSALQSTSAGGPTLVMPGAEDSSRFYSLIGLFALDNVLTTGRISAIGPDGKEVGSFDFALNVPGSAGHFGQVFLTALKNFTNPGTPVTIRVTITGGGRVGSYAVTVDLKTLDLTFIQGRPQS